MFMRFRKKNGQHAFEVAIIIMVVAGALIAMGMYLKRSYQGKLREGSDTIGPQFSAGETIGRKETITQTFSNETKAYNETTTTEIYQNQTVGVNETTPELGTEIFE